MNCDDHINYEYSTELDQEIRIILQEFREGKINAKQLLDLIDMSCREYFDQCILERKHEQKTSEEETDRDHPG